MVDDDNDLAGWECLLLHRLYRRNEVIPSLFGICTDNHGNIVRRLCHLSFFPLNCIQIMRVYLPPSAPESPCDSSTGMKGAFLSLGLGGGNPFPKPTHLTLIRISGTLVLTRNHKTGRWFATQLAGRPWASLVSLHSWSSVRSWA